MRTTMANGWVDHYLSEGETWAQWGMEQPNRHFAHVEDFAKHCGYCNRQLTVKRMSREEAKARFRVEA